MKKIIQSSLVLAALLAAGSAFASAYSSTLYFAKSIQPGEAWDMPLDKLYSFDAYQVHCTLDAYSSGEKKPAENSRILLVNQWTQYSDRIAHNVMFNGKQLVLYSSSTRSLSLHAGVQNEITIDNVHNDEKMSFENHDFSQNIEIACSAKPMGGS